MSKEDDKNKVITCPGFEQVGGWRQKEDNSEITICPVCGWERYGLLTSRWHQVYTSRIPEKYRGLLT